MSDENGNWVSDALDTRFTRRQLLKGGIVAGAAVGFGGLLNACGGSTPASSTSPSAAAQQPKSGGVLRVGLTGGSSTDSVDPLLQNNYPTLLLNATLYEALVALGPDCSMHNYLAEEITPNADATAWTIRLKPGITFQSGKDLTADDVAYTFNTIWHRNTVGATLLTQVDLKGMKKLDKLTLQVPMKTAYGPFVQTQPTWFFPIFPVGWDPKIPDGTGPFALESFTPGVRTTLKRNPNYWQSGLPHLDGVNLTVFADETSMVNAMLAGELDTISLISASEIQELQSQGKLVLVSPGGGKNNICMRVDRPPFNDVRVTQAMRLIVNRPQMLDLVWGGHGLIANDISSRWDPAYDTSIPQRVQDIAQAKSLLKAAGQENLTVTLVTADISLGVVSECEVFAQQAKAAGVTVNVEKTTTSSFFGPDYLQYTFAPDIWAFSYYMPQAATEYIGGAVYNEFHRNDPQYNKLYTEAVAIVDDSKRAEIIHEMMLLDYNKGAEIIAHIPPVIESYSSHVHGLVSSKIGAPWNNYDFLHYWLT